MTELTVADIERVLFEAFPRADAESWDNPGLAVGDLSQGVKGIAFALDCTARQVIAADEAGCNVLVTHHPPFIGSGPSSFGPQKQGSTTGPGRLVYEAVRRGVAVIAMHTNADRSVRVRNRFAEVLGWTCLGNFEHLEDASRAAGGAGFGAVFEMEPGCKLADVARICLSKLGGAPRVWGDPAKPIARVAYLNGSWGETSLYGTCLEHGIDCMIVGEPKYHPSLDSQPHLAVVDLGHDISELPIVDVLMDVVRENCGSVERLVDLRDSGANWWTCSDSE